MDACLVSAVFDWSLFYIYSQSLNRLVEDDILCPRGSFKVDKAQGTAESSLGEGGASYQI
jgi:hypothetical protein